MEKVFSLLLYGHISCWYRAVFQVQNEIKMPFVHLLAEIGNAIHPVHHKVILLLRKYFLISGWENFPSHFIDQLAVIHRCPTYRNIIFHTAKIWEFAEFLGKLTEKTFLCNYIFGFLLQNLNLSNMKKISILLQTLLLLTACS